MAFAAVALAAFLVSGLTLFSGFGLGTLLLPVFALFFPVEVAVAATALVHFANNVLKVLLFGRRADREVVVRFVFPAVACAFAGAAVLGLASRAEPLARYVVAGHAAVVTPLKLLLAALMALFALFELLPALRDLRFDRRWLPLGGAMSGFFGGLSGHQGALRAAFLTKVGLSTEAFVGTNAVSGFLVDAARLGVYGLVFLSAPASGMGERGWRLVAVGTASAFAGVLLGGRLVRKVTMGAVQLLAGVLLLAISAALGAGIV
ncbi:MAG TPA: TSUP family transporter [Anaeromyxobacteraceae bacterium]